MSSKSKLLTKRIISLFFVLAMVVGLVFSANISVSAENAAVNGVKNSLLQVRMNYTKNNEKKFVSSGTSFLINENTILTCAHVVNADDNGDLEALCNEYEGGPFKPNSVSYEVVISKDVTRPCSLVTMSVEDDFAVLTINSALGGYTPVTIGYSSDMRSTDQVYALGFPANIAVMQTTNTYTSEDVTVTEGIVQKSGIFDGTDCIVSAADLSEGNSGGPLVDENGHVVAINQSYQVRYERDTAFDAQAIRTGNFYSVSMDQVCNVLDKLLIEYTRDGEHPIDPTTEPTEVEPTAAPTEPPTQGPTESPEPPVPPTKNIIIIAIIALVVILIAIVVVILIVSSKKKNNGNGPKGGSGGTVIPPTVPQAPQMPQVPQRPQAPPYSRSQMPQGVAPTVPSAEGAGETSVLSQGAGETTVLGGSAVGGFTLIRKANNQKITINKPEFVIGKERRRVDYCIDNNNSISRTHAKLRVRTGKCYIMDLGSTNCTFVNGTKLSPNQEIELKAGDKIKLSDEEFEYLG